LGWVWWAAERIVLKLRGVAAAIKPDPFPFERPPRHDSFMGWFGGSLPIGRRLSPP